MLEKANAAKIIFEEHGYSETAKELASKLRVIAINKGNGKKLTTPDIKLLEVCQKIGRSPYTIGTWLKLVAVDSPSNISLSAISLKAIPPHLGHL